MKHEKLRKVLENIRIRENDCLSIVEDLKKPTFRLIFKMGLASICNVAFELEKIRTIMEYKTINNIND